MALLALSMLGIFAVEPPVAPLLWFGITMTGLFSAFSFLTISMYAEGRAGGGPAGRGGAPENLPAGARRGGRCWASAPRPSPPTLLEATGRPYAGFAVAFAILCLVALLLMRGQWGRGAQRTRRRAFRTILSDGLTRRSSG